MRSLAWDVPRWRWHVGVVLVLAMVLRLLWAVLVPMRPVSDSFAYDLLARNLAAGHGYCFVPGDPSAYWPVGTSAVAGLCYAVFGDTYAPIVALNLLAGVAIVWLAMVLARRWFGAGPAVLAGYLLACWPLMIQFTTVLASELWFSVLMLASLALWLTHAHTRRAMVVRIVGTGVLLAAAAYVRPTALLLPAVYAVIVMVSRREVWRPAWQGAAVAGVMALLILPWTVRNYRVFGEVVVISANSGANLWMGNNPYSVGRPQQIPAFPGLNEAKRDKELGALARAFVWEHPDRAAWLLVKKAKSLHDRETIGVAWNQEGLTERYGAGVLLPLRAGSTLYWYAMLVLGVAGTVVLCWRVGWWAAGHPALLLWGYFTGIHVVIVADDRYHMPSVPLVGMLAGTALAGAWGWYREGRAVRMGRRERAMVGTA